MTAPTEHASDLLKLTNETITVGEAIDYIARQSIAKGVDPEQAYTDAIAIRQSNTGKTIIFD